MMKSRMKKLAVIHSSQFNSMSFMNEPAYESNQDAHAYSTSYQNSLFNSDTL